MRDGPNRQYTSQWLQWTRQQPMYDAGINALYDRTYKHNFVHDHNLVDEFKLVFDQFIQGNDLSQLRGFDSFPQRDICMGCTHYIDDLYQRLGPCRLMTFAGDYKYHWRLNPNIIYTTVETLDPGKELLIAMPFPLTGDVHPQMSEILDRCQTLGIPVHVDGAWVTCCRDIDFDFDHPAVKTFAISLSKGGLGNDRIALRFARQQPPGAITIMNQFNMQCQSLLHIGMAFMQDLGPEYFWRKYAAANAKVCADFDLQPTKAIHLARAANGYPVGIRPLLRCLV